MGAAEGPHAECSRLLRRGDRDRWLASLLAPPAARPHLFALYAFSHEIARIREIVSDPVIGEMRMRWWLDALAGDPMGDAGHPVLVAVNEAIGRFDLPREPFLALIEARRFDLYEDQMPDTATLEGYCGETCSALFRLASLIIAGGADPGGADACGHAGVAYAMTGLMRALPWHAARGQAYLPADLMAKAGLTRDDLLHGRDGAALRAALAAWREIARDHAERALAVALPAPVRAALAPLSLVSLYLRRMERGDYSPFARPVEVSQWRRQWAMWRGMRR